MKLSFSASRCAVTAALLLLAFCCSQTRATVVVITSSNDTLTFANRESSFSPRVPQAGLAGKLHVANPLKGCEPLKDVDYASSGNFVLVERGDCFFEVKVRNAQAAGYDAVIVFNNDVDGELIIMTGRHAGIYIPAVFVSQAAGAVLTGYEGSLCYLLPMMDYPIWSIMAVAFISLLAVTGALGTFFFMRRHRLRDLGSRLLTNSRDRGETLSSSEVKALRIVHYKLPDATAASETCVICMEDYEDRQQLRVLPCNHGFHLGCIDQWLTTRKPFCPVCKRDARTRPETETTPLLAPNCVLPVILAPPATTAESISIAPQSRNLSRTSSNCSGSCSPVAVLASQSSAASQASSSCPQCSLPC